MRLVLRGYWYVFSVLLGAGVFAVIAHWVDTVLHVTSFEWPAQRAQHIGWVGGVIFWAVGIPFGWCQVSVGGEPSRLGKETSAPSEESSVPPEDRSLKRAICVGLVGAFAGLVIGFLLGATLFCMWLSISLSPWAPAEWASSLHVGMTGVATRHPMVGILWGGATAVLFLVGFIAGVTGAASGKAQATWQGKPL